jgi:predicted nucleotidyltransferase
MNPRDIEITLRAALAEAPEHILAAYLFGSVARNEAGPSSDVDVAVLYREAPPRSLDGLPFELQDHLASQMDRPVQVVVLNHAPVDLVHRVLRDGQLLLDRDPALRIRYEVWKRNEFFDLEPHLLRYRRLEPRSR